MNIELTHLNHFRFGYDGVPYVTRTSDQQNWWVDYGPTTRSCLSFYEECLTTARLLNQKANSLGLKINLLFSGGVDSEVMVESFRLAKVPFEIFIVEFENSLNKHDIDYAIKYCNQHNLSYRLLKLNLIEFWQKDGLTYAAQTQSVSPQLTVMMWAIDQLNGYTVLGSGECTLRKDLPTGLWHLHEKEKIASWYRHLILKNKNGCAGFFQYTPELMLSYLQDPMVTNLCQPQDHSLHSSIGIKTKFYQKYFSIEDRPKYTGFEQLTKEDANYRKQLESLYPASNSVFLTEVNHLIEKLRGANHLR